MPNGTAFVSMTSRTPYSSADGVQEDRTDVHSHRRHPHGFVSFSRLGPGRLLRIEFDFDPADPILELVTAYWVTP